MKDGKLNIVYQYASCVMTRKDRALTLNIQSSLQKQLLGVSSDVPVETPETKQESSKSSMENVVLNKRF